MRVCADVMGRIAPPEWFSARERSAATRPVALAPPRQVDALYVLYDDAE